jgi:fatty acid desaturase
VGVYAAWLGLTASYRWLPWWALLPAAGLLLAWHGSLQHEAVHGHPTRSTLVNTLVAGLPLSLWLPLPVYRLHHLAHHGAELTDPSEDPESYYVSGADWKRMGRPARALREVMNTLSGRLLLGPPVMVAGLYAGEARRIGRGDRSQLGIWAIHLLTCGVVLAWVMGVCRIPLSIYLGAFVYPGLAVTLLRSYAEHRPHRDPSARSVIVESGPLLSMVFLNNNLHAVHHRMPGLPWYELPARWRALRPEMLAQNGAYLYRGYGELVRRFAFAIKDSPVHPAELPCAEGERMPRARAELPCAEGERMPRARAELPCAEGERMPLDRAVLGGSDATRA